MYAAGLIPSAKEGRTRCSSIPNPAVGRTWMRNWTQSQIITSSIATAQKNAGSDDASVLTDQASALSIDGSYSTPRHSVRGGGQTARPESSTRAARGAGGAC